MATTKEAFHTAHNALSALELYVQMYATSPPFQEQKTNIEGVLLAEAQLYAADSQARSLLTALAGALRDMQ